MGLRALLDKWFPPPPPAVIIERYLTTGKERLIDDLFDGWIQLDEATEAQLMAIHERHAQKGDGFYGGLLRPEAKEDLRRLVRDLRQVGN